MPIVTVNETYEGLVKKQISGALINWRAQVRDATTGSSAQTYTVAGSNGSAVRVYLLSGRSGYQGFCSRSFFYFGGINTATGGATISSATVSIYGAQAFSTDTIVVEATAFGSGLSTSLTTGDYDNIDHSTPYSSARLSWSVGYNVYTLNSTAIANMNIEGKLNMALIEYVNDYGDVNPSIGTDNRITVGYANSTYPNKLTLTTASGIAFDVLDVPNSNIGKIIDGDL